MYCGIKINEQYFCNMVEPYKTLTIAMGLRLGGMIIATQRHNDELCNYICPVTFIFF